MDLVLIPPFMPPISTWGNLRLGFLVTHGGSPVTLRIQSEAEADVSKLYLMRPTGTHHGSDSYPVTKLARSHVQTSA
jgi:hypothetical protein